MINVFKLLMDLFPNRKTHILAGVMILKGVLGLFGIDPSVVTYDQPQAPVSDPTSNILLGGALSTLRAGVERQKKSEG